MNRKVFQIFIDFHTDVRFWKQNKTIEVQRPDHTLQEIKLSAEVSRRDKDKMEEGHGHRAHCELTWDNVLTWILRWLSCSYSQYIDRCLFQGCGCSCVCMYACVCMFTSVHVHEAWGGQKSNSGVILQKPQAEAGGLLVQGLHWLHLGTTLFLCCQYLCHCLDTFCVSKTSGPF